MRQLHLPKTAALGLGSTTLTPQHPVFWPTAFRGWPHGRTQMHTRTRPTDMPFFLRAIDAIVSVIGNGVAWLLVPMVVGQFALVLLRYVFGVGTIMGQEAVIFGHGTIFTVWLPL